MDSIKDECKKARLRRRSILLLKKARVDKQNQGFAYGSSQRNRTSLVNSGKKKVFDDMPKEGKNHNALFGDSQIEERFTKSLGKRKVLVDVTNMDSNKDKVPADIGDSSRKGYKSSKINSSSEFVASSSKIQISMLNDELEEINLRQTFFNGNAFRYGVISHQNHSHTRKTILHPSCRLSSGRHVISGGKLLTQVSQFGILEDGLISVGVEYDFNYDDISASQKLCSVSVGPYDNSTYLQEGFPFQPFPFLLRIHM